MGMDGVDGVDGGMGWMGVGWGGMGESERDGVDGRRRSGMGWKGLVIGERRLGAGCGKRDKVGGRVGGAG